MHPGQLTISTETVQRLMADQFPEWVGLPINEVSTPGTVNALFRIGDGLTARFPLQGLDVAAIRLVLQAEAEAARELLGRTPFATPRPVALGEPGHGYPLPWSVQTWLPGATAAASDASRSTALAHDIADFIRGVRAIDPRGRTFAGTGRGGDLRSHDVWVDTCLDRSEQLFDVPRLRRLWSELRELPRRGGDAMTHGDLIPGNVLVEDGRLIGVIDVGGLAAADPALDLVAGWHLLEAEPRQVLRDELQCDDLEWARGMAWAFEQAIGAAWYYRFTNDAMYEMGRATIARIMADSTLH